MNGLLSVIFLGLGIIIGSFLNVVIIRFNSGKSLNGRSACMACQSKLCWYELIPLISFVALGGRCRTCKTKISWQYPAVEISTGIIFLSLFIKFQDIFFLDPKIFTIAFIYYAFVFSLLTVIAFYDLRHKIIPDILAFKLGVITFIGLFLFTYQGWGIHVPALSNFLWGIYAALPFAFFWLISGGRWMGLGDVKIAIGLGWLLGSAVFSALVLSFWIGAIWGIFLMAFKKGTGMKSEVPFAPFLVLGTFLAFVLNLNVLPPF
jgi:leader peptidase (prepilin peptidase)/N-methyltransferase